jgi:hypothetical protein
MTDNDLTWQVRMADGPVVFSGSEPDADRWIANARHWDESRDLPFERHGMHKVERRP